MYAIEAIQSSHPPFVGGRQAAPAFESGDAPSTQLLLIDANTEDVALIQGILDQSKSDFHTEVTHVPDYNQVFEVLKGKAIDLILIDLSPANKATHSCFKALRKDFKTIPIIAITDKHDDDLAIQVLQEGAQEYIPKDEIDKKVLLRSMRYAIERNQLKIKLEAAYQRQLLSQKLESLGLIAGGVAHDFNNLLGAISGNAELGDLKTTDTSPIKKFLKNIITGCKRGGELCNQLMSFSGKGFLELTVCNFNDMLQELHQLIGVSIKKKIEIQYNLDPKLPNIEVDSAQIRQVIMNLLTNASDAFDDRDGKITLQTGTIKLDPIFIQGDIWASESIREWNTYTYLRVQDEGCGMDRETISRIFDPFFTTKFSGRGLGLAAVLGIVQAHKGAMKVESRPGEGSTFWFLLPSSNKKKQIKQKPKHIDKNWQGKGTILIADDEKDLREALKQYINSHGFKTLLARDGEEAFEIYQKHKSNISLVLLDMTMPRLSGKELYGKMSKMTPDMPILLMSGYSEKKIEHEFDKDVPLAFIKKPFRLDELGNSIHTLMNSGKKGL